MRVLAATGVLALVVALNAHRSSALDIDSSSQLSPDSVRALALTGLGLSLNDQFRSADSVFIAVSQSAAGSPIGPLFVAGNIQADMLDKESAANHERFFEYVSMAESRADSAARIRGAFTADEEFVLGVAAGYRSVYEARWGGWFAALKNGLRAKRHFERALLLDSALCDACLGLGSYHYWKSAKTDWVNWLPVISDERAKGIAMLELATRCGVYTRETARAALASTLINEERFLEAIAQADTLAQQLPKSKASLWLKAKALFALYEWDSALRIFDTLESRIRTEGNGNYFNLIECAYFRAQCHWGAGRYEQARNECGKALTYPADNEIKRRQRSKLDDLRKLQRKLTKLMAR